MKRFSVIELFSRDKTEVCDEEWHIVHDQMTREDLPYDRSCKIWVKLFNGIERFAYFFEDRCDLGWMQNKRLSYFWDCRTHEPLIDVIGWKNLKEPKEKDNG